MTSQRKKNIKNKTSLEKNKASTKIKTKTTRGANIVNRTTGRREEVERGRWNDEEDEEEEDREWMEGMEDEKKGWEEEEEGGESRTRGGGDGGGDGGRKVSRNRRSLGAGSVAKRKHQRNHRCTMRQNQVILRQ